MGRSSTQEQEKRKEDFLLLRAAPAPELVSGSCGDRLVLRLNVVKLTGVDHGRATVSAIEWLRGGAQLGWWLDGYVVRRSVHAYA